ncbi:MAG: type IV pilus secretin PilQ [Nitrospirae bacterium]|nr:type IV pilus secretin PilQ [Nitrospirota bacterium]
MILRKSHLLFLIVLAVLTLQLSNVQAKINSEITGIDVREVDGTTEIEIMSTTPLTYTMYTSDPYRIVLEMQNTALKGIKKKVFDRAGVMEVMPSLIQGVPDAVKLEISLTDPVDVKPMQKGGSLILAFNTPAKLAEAEGENTSAANAQASGKEIQSIALSKSGDKLLVTISGNSEMVAKVMNADNNKLVVDIPDVTTAIDAPRVSEPPVQGIRIGKHADKTRLVFDLTGPAVYDISPSGNQIVISFNMPGAETPRAAVTPVMPAPVVTEKQGTQEAKALCDSESGQYSGEKINLDMQDADLIHIFRLIADVSGCNVVVSPQVSGKFSMRLIDVPWDQALEMILNNYDLEKRVNGNIIRIAKRDSFIKEDEDTRKLRETEESAGELVSKTYKINFADVAKVKEMIKTSPKGSINIDSRTSTLIIKDVEQNHAKFRDIIDTIDKRTPQVNIDARIVEVSKGFTKEFGIQWGADIRPSVDTAVGGITGTGTGSTSFASGNPLLINLPAAAGAGTGGAIGFGYLGAGALRALDLQLSAMEDTGNGKLVSNPRIITLDNESATIKQGSSIPYSSVSQNGTETKFVDANLELKVTPHVTPDGTIVMEVAIKKDEADFGKAVNGQPAISTKQAETKVLIMDGDTLVIGGIFKTTISESEGKFPGLGNIPVLGWLFKKQKKEQKTEELLIFITPSIVR